MSEWLCWIWPIGLGAIEGIAILVLMWKVREQRLRHRTLVAETTGMLVMHQDTLATLDARLRALGSRTSGDIPIPTGAEIIEGKWQR